MGKTLIFPCGVPAARTYAEAARQRGEATIAASSLAYDESAARFDSWIFLPSVYDKDFPGRLNAVIAEHGIDRIFAPVSAAHWGISKLIADGVVAVPLIGEMPLRQHAREHAELIEQAEERLASIRTISEGRSGLGVIEVAAVLRKAMGFFGESDEAKIAAMLAIFADAPRGDIVEIGVLTGRSTCVLEMMAHRYRIGPVLAIDPWAYAESVQQESPSELQAMVDVWEARVPFETFLVELLPIAREGAFNYLPMTSRAGHGIWSAKGEVSSPEFGTTRYGRDIAILHIDGNHDHAAVKDDVDLWLPHMGSGGWLILDDYFWLHGTGPRRVGDAILETRAADISRAFVCGRALFVQFGPKHVP
ncbi:class I SAM-dependent methyltransferase [Bosea sp. (in: a-proteobacteria)]|jgi:hypothetical protein|uniref:class I SAM-dependent methyltransferase n=1 Tax=Bosea sp. (in: a-proteobacteria) TaxID=1871050 RepID=UPI00356AB382